MEHDIEQFGQETPFDLKQFSKDSEILNSSEEWRLYAWRPKGHGEYSFYVVARSAFEAGERIGEFIAENPTIYDPKKEISYTLDAEGWGTDYYELEVAELGQVLVNAND